ncbi:TetR/AcrR family transcriptional regulator [Microbacterium sp.]|uniref:TetR/AcrR family transcriptional regulator n=1 Tax=Microbacterium sp. TaxID=51671 RepID=UPI0035AFCE99
MKYLRSDILDAAVDVLDQEGLGVSTARLAARVGVSNGTLFNYFPTRQDLIDALYLHLKRDLASAIGDTDGSASAKDRAREVWDRWVAWGCAAPARHRVVLLLKGGGAVGAVALAEAAELFAGVSNLLDSAAREGDLVDMPLPYLAAVIEAQVDLAVSNGLRGAARAVAFEMAWASIASPTLHTASA